ncbi:MAG: sensor histidine kinase, partial [Oscillospiraceae bacterium]|nr:sensor histidine kinase [Oscillospiraceae bacterium]
IKLLSEIREDSKWLNRMVENLLSVTRIDSENVQVIKTPTVLEELIDAVILKFHKHCPEQDVRVKIPEEFISIPMDALLIEQVIINILENAVFHAKGMTELSLNVKTKDRLAVFEISDNGCGIPKDRLEHLFSGYLERIDVSADSSRSNMGIGLSVCASIIKAHGSIISAENLKNGGALFRFALEMEE